MRFFSFEKQLVKKKKKYFVILLKKKCTCIEFEKKIVDKRKLKKNYENKIRWRFKESWDWPDFWLVVNDVDVVPDLVMLYHGVDVVSLFSMRWHELHVVDHDLDHDHDDCVHVNVVVRYSVIFDGFACNDAPDLYHVHVDATLRPFRR